MDALLEEFAAGRLPVAELFDEVSRTKRKRQTRLWCMLL
jgi:hypothetical protein